MIDIDTSPTSETLIECVVRVSGRCVGADVLPGPIFGH
jgi:hypothetical protein